MPARRVKPYPVTHAYNAYTCIKKEKNWEIKELLYGRFFKKHCAI